MANEFERKESSGGLTFKLYRVEGVALLAFDLDPAQATDDFVGFSVEVKYPGSNNFGALRNRLHFDLPPNIERPRSFKSTEAPFQKFRWIHVPTRVGGGEFRYRVTAKYMNGSGQLTSGPQVENAISLNPKTIDGFVNVGFTRGFASSQAYGKVPILAKVPFRPDTSVSQDQRIQDFNVVIDELVVANNIPVAPPDFYTYFKQHQQQLPDGVHPDGAGYKAMAQIWFNALIGAALWA